MLTNEKIAAIHANAVAHGFWEPGSEPTFGEYCALIHEEISEAFSAWRKGEPDEYIVDGKPEGVWVELADVVIRCADILGYFDTDYDDAVVHMYDGTYANILHAMQESPVNFICHIGIMHHTVSTAFQDDIKFAKTKSIIVLTFYIYALAEHNGIDLDAIIDRKCAYNATRPWRHGKRM